MPIHIALLRAIGPATHAKMSMQDLRDGCEAAGLAGVRTYIQTGNLILKTRRTAKSVQTTVEQVLLGFGLTNQVFLRTPEQLAAIVTALPFPEAAAEHPGELCVCFMAGAPDPQHLAGLNAYPGPEKLAWIGGDLCVDYADGVAGSKLMPAVIERRLATSCTARNWNTVQKLLAMAATFDA